MPACSALFEDQLCHLPISLFHITISIFSAQVTAKYFEQLSDEDINKIYTVYEDDFKLFDYTFNFGNISLPTVEN